MEHEPHYIQGNRVCTGLRDNYNWQICSDFKNSKFHGTQTYHIQPLGGQCNHFHGTQLKWILRICHQVVAFKESVFHGTRSYNVVIVNPL